MANLIMDFLEGALPTIGAVGGGILGAAGGELVDPFGGGIPGGIAGASAGSTLGQGAENVLQGKSLTNNLIPAAVGGAVGQGVGGLAAKGFEAVAPEALTAGSGVASKVVAGAAKGATVGGTSSTAAAVAEGERNPKNLAMDFIQGAGIGGVTGGALGGIAHPSPVSADFQGTPSSQFSQDDLMSMSKSDNPKAIAKTLEPVTGDVVAQQIAPAIALQSDVPTISRIIDNELSNKLAPATPSPAPTPLPPTTSVSDINTPQQVAEQGTAVEQNFMNAPDEANPQPTVVNSLGAEAGMKQILNSGGTVDEAMNHHMETTGSNYGEAQAAVGKIMQGNDVNRANVNASLNPEMEHASNVLPKVQENDIEQPIKNAQAISNETMRRANMALDEVDKLSPNDMKLMDSLRGNTPDALVGQAKDKAQFLKAANAVKNYNDFTQGVGSGALGQDVAYRQNYGAPLLFDNTPEGQTKLEAATAQLKTSPGYGKGRFFNSYDEASQYGLQRRNENFMGDLAEDAGRRANDLSQLALAKGLDEAFPGQTKIGQIGATSEGTYKQLLVPGGQKISMPAQIADRINERAPAPDAKGLLSGYDTLNANWKNLKLAGGGFHSINVMGSYVGQQIASGKAFSDPTSISDMVKATLSKNAFNSSVREWESNGRLLDMDAAGLQHNALSSQADVAPSGKLGNIPVLKQIHEAIFGRQIPYMKMRIFDQETQGLDRNNPEDLKQMTQVAKELNQNFGGMNRAIQGLTPRQFKVLSRVFLATDYNEGQIRTLGDAFSKGGVDGNLARQVVFGKALLWAGLATAGGAIGGEFKGQTPQQVALNILQKTVNPKFNFGNYTVGLPTTQLSELGKPTLETAQNAVSGASVVNPFKDFASARLAAIPSGVEQVASNRNFSGNAIYGTDYYGRPISPGQTASSIASMVAPIPVAQGANTLSGQENPVAAIANVAGVRATPTNSLQYAPVAGQTYIQKLAQTPGVTQPQIDADTQFVAALGAGDRGKTQTILAAEKALQSKNPDQAQQIINTFNQKLVQALKPWEQSGGAQYLDTNMLQLLRNTMITYKTVNSNLRSNLKNNPTAVGAPIAALANAPTPVNQT